MSAPTAEIDAARFAGAIARIKALQQPSGAITWYAHGVFDPWNHGLSAMALRLCGEREAADAALDHLARTQLSCGSWWAEYGMLTELSTDTEAPPTDPKRIRDTNFTAGVASVVWHEFRLTADRKRLARRFPMVAKAIGFILAHQSEHGEIRWAAADPHTPEDDALVTGSSSIYKSLDSAIRIASALGEAAIAAEWATARARLGHALRVRPERFDRTWAPKSGFAMDWYYPVLSGAMRGDMARARIDARWEEFVVEGMGCRCIVGAPWVTIAEACELAMALAGLGRTRQARALLGWQEQFRDEGGAYWMGHQYEEDRPWPEECPPWTAAAVILATDAIERSSPAATLFLEHLPEPA